METNEKEILHFDSFRVKGRTPSGAADDGRHRERVAVAFPSVPRLTHQNTFVNNKLCFSITYKKMKKYLLKVLQTSIKCGIVKLR